MLHTVHLPYTVLFMSQKLTDEQEGEAIVLALRLPQKLIEALDQVQREQESKMTVKARLSRSSVARALLEEALRKHGALSEAAKPSESKPKEPAPSPEVARSAKVKRKGTPSTKSKPVAKSKGKRKHG